MSMNELSPDVIECNLARPAFYDPDVIEINFVKPKFIQDDEGMNDEEKDEAFLHYMKFGYHHPSMTKEVEENAALTELKFHKDVPLDDEDFESQFDLAHLPMKNRRWAYQMFRRQKDAFSKHSADIGCASDISMKIDPVSQDPHVQKYTPLPYPVRDQVRAILDQMLESSSENAMNLHLSAAIC